jgi:hypothetical protein
MRLSILTQTSLTMTKICVNPTKNNMSEIREEALFAADDTFWRQCIENREMLAQCGIQN